MNNSTADIDKDLIIQLNDEKARLMLPATVYIIILMISGIMGNPMICYFYGIKTKATTNGFFIVTLAVYDLIVCCICMPTEIVDIELFYTFENDGACKVLRFVNYFAGVASILTLIAIAVDRYRKIYKPTKKQMTMKIAKGSSLLIAAVAVMLSWPSLAIYGSIKVNIPNEFNKTLMGSDCTSTKDKLYRPYVWAFNLVHFVSFFVCTVVLIVMYTIIGKTIYNHNKMFSKYKNKGMNVELNQVSISNSKSSSSATEASNKGDPHAEALIKDGKDNTRKVSRKTGPDKESIRITVVMIVITVLFIASFLPYLSLTIWRVIEKKHEAEFLSGEGLVGFKIGSRSFLLNSSLNPWIYGIFNSSFRKFYFGKICSGK